MSPLDPRIPLGVQAPQIENPFDALSKIAYLQQVRDSAEARRLAGEEARTKALKAQQAEAAQAQVDAVLKEAITIGADGQTTVDWGKLIGHLPSEKFFAVKKQFEEDQTRVIDLRQKKTALEKDHIALRGSVARSVEKSGYDPTRGYDPTVLGAGLTVLRNVGAITPEEAARGLTATPEEQQRFVAAAIAAEQAAAGGTEDLATVETVEGGVTGTKFVPKVAGQFYPAPPKAATAAETVSHQSEWVLLPGQSEPVLASYNPKTKQLLYQDRDITAEARRVPPPPPQGPYMWAVPPGGAAPELLTPTEIREGGAQRPPEPATGAQYLAAGYATRMGQAEGTLGSAIGDSIRSMSLPSFELQTNSWFAKPTFQSNDVQAYMQSARNFINAVLRRESGAAIQPSEFAEAKAQYLPVPGDTDEAKALKKANRDAVFENMRREAGRAYEAPAPKDEAKHKVGDILTVRGQKVRVTKLLPNGKYEGVVVP